jgi:hypothetical protein
MEFTSCPWDSMTQFPAHFCETNLCAWIVQPANTWSDISYLIAAAFILFRTDWRPERLRFSFIVFCLFIGSTLFHMTSTVIGREMDVGAMLMLSTYSLCFTLSRSFKFHITTTAWMALILFLISIPAIPINMGSILFLIQFIATILLELLYSRRHPPTAEAKKSLMLSFGIFTIALVINIMDMNKIYCIPDNNILTLHAIWHLLCGFCIYLLVKYYCLQKKAPSN